MAVGALAAATAPVAAIAQPILVTCTGTLVQFTTERFEGNVSPTSATREGKPRPAPASHNRSGAILDPILDQI